MKKILLLNVVTLLLCSTISAQKYEVTPQGLKNSDDKEKSFLVLKVDNTNAQTLYKRALKYVNENYNNPKEVIVGNTENEFLKLKTFSSDFIDYSNGGVSIQITASYYILLKFKDSKVKYEIETLEMKALKYPQYVIFKGGMFSGYIIYKKNGKLFKESAKIDIEKYFNNEVGSLLRYLKAGNTSDDW